MIESPKVKIKSIECPDPPQEVVEWLKECERIIAEQMMVDSKCLIKGSLTGTAAELKFKLGIG